MNQNEDTIFKNGWKDLAETGPKFSSGLLLGP